MSAEIQGKQAATTFRIKHHLGVQPLGDLVTLIEQNTGHDVAIIKAAADEHGLTMRDPLNEVVFIGIACTRNPMRQRSTLAHELGHVLFTDWDTGEDINFRSQEEIRADAFARHLLLPEDSLRELLGHREDFSQNDLSMVVQRFQVSPAMAAIALHNCGYIDGATKTKWMALSTPQMASRYGWIDQYRILQDNSDRPRAPQRLLARTISGYEDGVVNLQTVATLRGLAVKKVAAEFDAYKISPRELTIPTLAASDLPPANVALTDLEDEFTDESAQ